VSVVYVEIVMVLFRIAENTALLAGEAQTIETGRQGA